MIDTEVVESPNSWWGSLQELIDEDPTLSSTTAYYTLVIFAVYITLRIISMRETERVQIHFNKAS